jgi:hypothetical protein
MGMKRTVANLMIRQLGTCAGPGCERELTMHADDDLYICCKNVVIGFCSRACYLKRVAIVFRSQRADRKISQRDLLGAMGYDPEQPQPPLPVEGAPPPVRKKRKRG